MLMVKIINEGKIRKIGLRKIRVVTLCPINFRIKSYGTGKYGRVLADIFIQDKEGKTIFINETLIKEGHAYVYDGGTKKVFTS